mgnify:FL=1
MSLATVVVTDGRNSYAGTSKYDGTLENRQKFIEDFAKVCRKVNPLAYLIVRRTIPIHEIPGDVLGGHEWDRGSHIKKWKSVSHLNRRQRWSKNIYTIQELIDCGHLAPKMYEDLEK